MLSILQDIEAPESVPVLLHALLGFAARLPQLGGESRSAPLVLLERSAIARKETSGVSLRPEGLLDDMSEQDVRDLFAYLRSTQPQGSCIGNYQWQKAFFENGAAAFQRSPRTETLQKRDHLVEALEAKLKRKDEVIAIIAEDLIREKKANGVS